MNTYYESPKDIQDIKLELIKLNDKAINIENRIQNIEYTIKEDIRIVSTLLKSNKIYYVNSLVYSIGLICVTVFGIAIIKSRK